MFRWWIRKRYKLKKEPEDLREVLLTWPDEEIQKYIRDYFGYSSNKNKKIELHRIRRLDLDTIILGIARMKEIEEYYDNSKFIAGFSTTFIFLASQLIYFTQNKFYGIGVFIGMFICGLLSHLAITGNSNRSKAIQYRSLLEQVKSEMEKAS
ncbi:hypothetical protein QKW52_21760 [Bacillus sonorensis]|nr:hypothetical protein [Bacillus sonorensis]